MSHIVYMWQSWHTHVAHLCMAQRHPLCHASYDCVGYVTEDIHVAVMSHMIYMRYGVATISRLLQILGLFCKRALYKRRYSAKETYNFKEPINRSHPICHMHAIQVQPVPWKMRLTMFIGTQNEILIGIMKLLF